jgi:hypothetical protein
MLALYLTIWIGLTLFVAGETGRSFTRRSTGAPTWSWWAFSTGLLLAIVHTVLAFDIVHNWVHDDAVRSTAMQTEAVFGVAVGGGVYVNYAFLAAWFADAVWWRAAPAGHPRSAALTWTLRAFYMVMIVNGAIVFATGARRLLGIALVTWLCVCWTASRPTPAPCARHR